MRSLLILVASLAFSTPAASRTWHILPDGTGDAPTIQAGVDSASAGDIVLVAAGTYSTLSTVMIDGTPTQVCVSINKDIRLLSEDGPATTTIGHDDAGVVIYMQSVDSSAEVKGFTIASHFGGFGCVGPFPSAPVVWTFGFRCQASSPRIIGNIIIDNTTGVRLESSPARIEGNTIDDAAYGIECKGGSDALITDNTISNCGLSIYSEASDVQVVGNDLFGGCSAIEGIMSSLVIRENLIHGFESSGISGRTQLVIEENTFFDQPAIGCIQLSGPTVTASIRGNVFYHIGTAARLSGSVNVTLVNNTIDDAIYAFACEAASPTIRNNIVVHADGGLFCSLSSNPVFECNNIFDVAIPFDGACPNQIGINGNIAADPQFCGIPGSHNYTLQGDSPCAPGNHPNGDPCGQIGALGVACGTVPTKSMTWGRFKALYEGKRR